MSDHSFNPFIAQKYDVNCAIFLTSMVFWTRLNASNEHNFYEERYWTYNTPEQMVKYFPYWSPSQIKRIIQKCHECGLIEKSNWNKKGYDRTNWYALSDKALSELNLDRTCLQPASGLIRRNRPMDQTKSSDALDEIVRPIPVTNTSTNTVNKRDITCVRAREEIPQSNSLSNPDHEYQDTYYLTDGRRTTEITTRELNNFERFWALYPRKNSKTRVLSQWIHDGCDSIADEIINKLQEQIKKDKSFIDGCVPNPWKYIVERRFEDEIYHGKKTNGFYDYEDLTWADKKDIFDEI